MPAFVTHKQIRFQHCDPAGIVFYPEYFLLANEVVEDWFQDGLGVDFRKMHLDDHIGIPVRKTACEFFATSMIGDRLDWSLTVSRVGGSSVAMTIRASSGGEQRAVFEHLIVYASMKTRKAIPLPEDLRARMLGFKE